MNGSLLICIAFHNSPDRLKYLNQVINSFLTEYKVPIRIIVDTNKPLCLKEYSLYDNVEVFVHENLAHPFHLTWMHRRHIKDNIDNYDNFAYFEDDMYLPFENYQNYIEKFKILWPKYVPSFIRIEKKDNHEYVSDIVSKKGFNGCGFRVLYHEGKSMFFMKIPFPENYYAFWIMPQRELKESMKDNFCRLSDGREFAAMYTGWELGKPSLIEAEQKGGYVWMIKKDCYSYHLPNNYALSNDTMQAKIKPEDIFL